MMAHLVDTFIYREVDNECIGRKPMQTMRAILPLYFLTWCIQHASPLAVYAHFVFPCVGLGLAYGTVV